MHRRHFLLSTLGLAAASLAAALPARAERRLELHKESHQYIDIVSMFRPLTKWNARIEDTEQIPELVRKAFKTAMTEKTGPVHLELPEDVASLAAERGPLPLRPVVYPEAGERMLRQAAELIEGSRHPIVIAGNGVIRSRASAELLDFSERLRIPVATTFRGMGAVPADHELFISTIGLQARDYISCGLDKADLIIAKQRNTNLDRSLQKWGCASLQRLL